MSTKSNDAQRTRTQTQLLPFNKKNIHRKVIGKKSLRSNYIWCFVQKKIIKWINVILSADFINKDMNVILPTAIRGQFFHLDYFKD